MKTASLNRRVFYTSSLIIACVLTLTVLFSQVADQVFNDAQSAIVVHMSWYYVLVVAVFLVTVLFLAFSRFGSIKLGPDHAEPDYSFWTWFSMLFSAGMGIGLMFFGVAEPVMHFLNPPVGQGETVESAREAMSITFFHWGLHAWGIYGLVGLILAYFSFRRSLPLTLRSALYPMIGERIYGVWGDVVDVFAILGTVFGVATSLGFGVLQMNAGLHVLINSVPVSLTVQVALIVAATGIATFSVVAGLDRGIKWLSQINAGLAVALLLLILALGPTVLLLQTLVQNIGHYLSEIVGKTLNLYAYAPTKWEYAWTIFYWGWWMAWAPFVGVFIARISRGRSIREFVIGVVLVPSAFTMLWFTVFGNAAINMILHQGFSSLGILVTRDQSVALFQFLSSFPLSSLLSFLAILMVMTFFVTSADSGAMVLNMLTSHGEDNTPVWRKVYWSSLVGGVALILLVEGGLHALQTATIVSALPFSFVLLVSLYGLISALRSDDAKRRSQSVAVTSPSLAPEVRGWRQRVKNLFVFPSQEDVCAFIETTVRASMESFAEELRSNSVEARVTQPSPQTVCLTAFHGEEDAFVYQVSCTSQPTPDETLLLESSEDSSEKDQEQEFYRAEVFLSEGGQNYTVMGWSEQQVLSDILTQYEKHLHYLHSQR